MGGVLLVIFWKIENRFVIIFCFGGIRYSDLDTILIYRHLANS